MNIAELQAIDDWSFANRIRSRDEAVLRLVKHAIPSISASPAEAGEPSKVMAHGIPVPPGPYPWQAADLLNAMKALNVLAPARLKAQLDWIVRRIEDIGHPVSLRQLVVSALEEFVARELRALGIEP